MIQPSEWIDGDCLVLTDRTALPLRCVRTNQPVSERECKTLDLPWIPGALKIAMCFVPVLLLFAPSAIRRRCRIRAGISSGVRLHYLARKLLAGLVIAGAAVVPNVCIISGWGGPAVVTIAIFPVLFWGGFIFLILFTSPLTIARHEGVHFWIKGCSPEFLASIKASLDESAEIPVA